MADEAPLFRLQSSSLPATREAQAELAAALQEGRRDFLRGTLAGAASLGTLAARPSRRRRPARKAPRRRTRRRTSITTFPPPTRRSTGATSASRSSRWWKSIRATYVTIETLTHHANDDAERMIKGDPGAESVFHWDKDKKNVDRRGAGPMKPTLFGRGAGEGLGVHICTGPVFVRDAEPGDILEVRILDVKPRPSANPAYAGKAFGSNAAAWWGFHYKDLLTEPKPREVITIYEIDASGEKNWARAVYNFQWTPQTDPFGVVHKTIDYPGVPVDHKTVKEKHGILKNVRIPLRPHFGVMGVAPKEADMVDSIPPGYFGGNMDNWRVGKGAVMYYPVAVPGAPVLGRRSARLAGRLRAVRHGHRVLADRDLPARAAQEEGPGRHRPGGTRLPAAGDARTSGASTASATPTTWKSWARNAQSEIYKKSSIDLALRDAFRKMRRFLMTTKRLTEDEAISLMSVAVDFGVTQVVDGNWGIHAVIKKSLFAGETA